MFRGINAIFFDAFGLSTRARARKNRGMEVMERLSVPAGWKRRPKCLTFVTFAILRFLRSLRVFVVFVLRRRPAQNKNEAKQRQGASQSKKNEKAKKTKKK